MQFVRDADYGRLENEAVIRVSTGLDGRRIVFRCFGDGLPLVLLHGGHGNWKHWLANIGFLSQHFQVWIPDMPGFGDSDNLDPGADIEMLSAKISDALDDLIGCDSIFLAGFSFGGLVASHVSRKRQVSRLALLGCAGHGTAERKFGPLKNWRGIVSPVERWAALRENLSTFMLRQPASIDETTVSIYEEMCLTTRFHSKPISKAGGLAAVLATIAAPILLIWGGEDVTSSRPEDFVETLGLRQNVELVKVAGAGHWVQWEFPNLVNTMLKEWFAS
jgi:pimeloyl-ACP methyl ester carboxylesterase